MGPNGIVEKAKEQLVKATNLVVDGVVGITKTEEGWLVSLEMLERRSIPDTMDLLGLYEVKLYDDGKLVGFDRKRVRKRGTTTVEEGAVA